MISVVPFADRAEVAVVNVMVEPVGARSGTLWQATATSPTIDRTERERHRPVSGIIIKTVTILFS
jgi:hypothetical protein